MVPPEQGGAVLEAGGTTRTEWRRPRADGTMIRYSRSTQTISAQYRSPRRSCAIPQILQKGFTVALPFHSRRANSTTRLCTNSACSRCVRNSVCPQETDNGPPLEGTANKVYHPHRVAPSAQGRYESKRNHEESTHAEMQVESAKNMFSEQTDRLTSVFKNTSRRVYVIDDYPYNIHAVKVLLEATGLEVEGEISASLAIAHLREMNASESYYAVVLVDMNMPEMDGLECTRRIRNMMSKSEIWPIKIV